MSISDLVKEFIFDCKVRELSPRTIHNYEKQLKQFELFLSGSCNVLKLEELKPIHVKEFIAMLQNRGCKPSYINDLLKAVKVLCGYAYREGYCTEPATQRIKKVQEPKVMIHTFSNDEIKRLIGYYKGKD